MKKAVSLLLALALVIVGNGFVSKVKAESGMENWKANAVITPAEGRLVGAGYIKVEFDNSVSGYTYKVLLDNKPVYWNGDDIVRTDIGETVTEGSKEKTFTSSDEGVTEVYTTTISKHTITVVATNGSETITSQPREFYVSKKGMALGGDMSKKIALSDLNCSWYYNWATEAFNNNLDKNVEHIPMMWGAGDDSKEGVENLDTTADYILGFNEPDIDSQANMFFSEAIEVWNEYIAPLSLRKVAPAPAAPGGDSGWLKDFMNGNEICKNPFHPEQWDYFSKFSDNEFAQQTRQSVKGVMNDDSIDNDVDAVVLHFYMPFMNFEMLDNAVNTLWNLYHKPVWITEIGVFGVKGAQNDYSYELPEQRQAMADYVTRIVERLDSYPFVERYCMFAYDVDSANEIDNFNGSGATAMFEYASGRYTDLGKLYSRIGNPEGYEGTNIQNYPGFEWEDRVRSQFDYDPATDSVKVTWHEGPLDIASHKVVIEKKVIDPSTQEETTVEEEYDVENGGSIDVSNLEAGKYMCKVLLYDSEGTEVFNKQKSFVKSKEITTTAQVTTKAPETTVGPVATTVAPTNPAVETKAPVKLAKAKIKSAKNVKKKSVKLSWKAVTGAKSYQLQYALNKKFTKKAKSKTVKKTSFKVTKLSKKKYFFRVRAICDSVKGAWSGVKTVKVKK